MPHESPSPDLPYSPGNPWPLGATWDGAGTQFALYSGVAEQVELCLFAADGEQERARIPLACTDGIWHGYLQGCRPGTLYGYRVHGPWLPEAGDRCNGAKLLLDPWAREVVGRYGFDADGAPAAEAVKLAAQVEVPEAFALANPGRIVIKMNVTP